MDTNYGWAMSADSAGSNIISTQNGGQSWEYQAYLTPPLQNIFFVNSIKGWCVSEFGYIYHTADGGKNWECQHSGIRVEDTLYDLFFVNDSMGWAAGESSQIWHTSNGGKSWEQQYAPCGPYEFFMTVDFTDENHGWLAGIAGIMLYTNDGGKNWDISYSEMYGYWWSDLEFTDRDHGWAVGLYGSIYKWTGNSNSLAQPTKINPTEFQLNQNYPNPFTANSHYLTTQIEYFLPSTLPVTVTIYNTLGQIVRVFNEGQKLAGKYTVSWNGCDNNGNLLSSGIYYYQVKAGKDVKIGKMTLIR